MEWLVKIENDSKKRILVKFNPLTEDVSFIAQYHPSSKDWVIIHDIAWVDFCTETVTMDSISLEFIQEVIFRVYEKMNDRLKVHSDLSENFKIIKTIEVKED